MAFLSILSESGYEGTLTGIDQVLACQLLLAPAAAVASAGISLPTRNHAEVFLQFCPPVAWLAFAQINW